MTNGLDASSADRVIAGDRIGGAVLMGGAGALGGGLLGAKTMLDKTFEDYKADRLAWSQRKQRAREQGLNTREIDRERPKWVLPYLKAAIKGSLVGGTIGGLGGGSLGALTGPSLMRAAARDTAEKQRNRIREKFEKMQSEASSKKTSSLDSRLAADCFDLVHRHFKQTQPGPTSGKTASDPLVNHFLDAIPSRPLINEDRVKRLVRGLLLGGTGAAVGGSIGALLPRKKEYDEHGNVKRRSRAGTGALFGGGAAATLGLLANS